MGELLDYHFLSSIPEIDDFNSATFPEYRSVCSNIPMSRRNPKPRREQFSTARF